MKQIVPAATAISLMFLAATGHATEGGGTTYPVGVENFLVSVVPPPGVHLLEYGMVYSAKKQFDGKGNDLAIPGFKVGSTVLVTKLAWSTNLKLLGGNLLWAVAVPLMDLQIEAGGMTQHKSGFGDITWGPSIGTHYSPELHTVVGIDAVLPVGSYSASNMANLGRNYYSVQPFYGVSFTKPSGFNGDLKTTFNFNTENRDTRYKSGSEWFLDYAAGWGFGNGWVGGLGGHMRRQFTDDTAAGAEIGNRSQSFGLGPSVKYQNEKGWFITAKLQSETGVKSSTRGTALWIKTLIPI